MRQFGWGPRQVGYVFAYVGVLSAVMQGGLIGPLTRRFGEERLLLRGLALIARRAAAAAARARRSRCWSRASAALALGMGAMQPSLNSLISRRAGREEQGEVMGVAQSVGSLSRVLGPSSPARCSPDSAATARFCWGAALVGGAPSLVGWRAPRRRGRAAPRCRAARLEPPNGGRRG